MAKKKKTAKKSAQKKSRMAKVTRKRKVVARMKRTRAPARKAKTRRAAGRTKPAAVRASPKTQESFLESAVLESADAAAGGRLEALQRKLSALQAIERALNARRTFRPEDEIEINPALTQVIGMKRTVEAQIATAQTAVLAPPNEADVTALSSAIRDAENVVAQNAAVNQLVRAAAALVRVLSS